MNNIKELESQLENAKQREAQTLNHGHNKWVEETKAQCKTFWASRQGKTLIRNSNGRKINVKYEDILAWESES